ncbi:outer membrane protein assembly factor BamC [Candidatus Profftia lariciata]|uniref:outer membrane protein assembly factor BamC n=1 Tax=Candidatus Profftia lariciata TaxID=1987921 RepID=UPI001D006DB7|nr:outer membrane protein assembly factor BamC [Candidatus Profftia lariciata]
MMIPACSTNQLYKHQINGTEQYLHASMLSDLKTPKGIILPLHNNTYNIPMFLGNGKIGKSLDIRPPVHILPLLNNSFSYLTNNIATVLIDNILKEKDLWTEVIHVIKQNNYPISYYNYAEKKIITNWIIFQQVDKNLQYKGRYQISIQQKNNYQTAFIVKSLNLQQGNTIITEEDNIQRYTIYVINDLLGALAYNHQIDQ